jgi:hypothetical protein
MRGIVTGLTIMSGNQINPTFFVVVCPAVKLLYSIFSRCDHKKKKTGSGRREDQDYRRSS